MREEVSKSRVSSKRGTSQPLCIEECWKGAIRLSIYLDFDKRAIAWVRSLIRRRSRQGSSVCRYAEPCAEIKVRAAPWVSLESMHD